MRLFEIIDDADDEKMHMILEYCPHGDIMHLNEASLTFQPPEILLSHLPPAGRGDNLNFNPNSEIDNESRDSRAQSETAFQKLTKLGK